MTLATRSVQGNNSGYYLRRPKIVVMHSTRSGRADFTDAQELAATLSWFTNPDGASSHWVLSELERVRVVADTLIAWASAYLNSRSWQIEITQPTRDRPFRDGHYSNAALVGRHYVALGVAPVWLPYWDGNLIESGFVDHQDTIQGRESGKSDIGPKFDRPRFIASLEDEMTQDEFNKMLRKGLKTIKVKAHTDTGLSIGREARTVLNWLEQLRETRSGLERHKDKPHAGGYTDEEAVKAVKDKL